jgi:hypothetical protein
LPENRVLRRILVPKNDEMRDSWIKVHNEELHDLYSLPNMMRTAVKENEMGTECCMNAGEVHCI